MILILTDRYFYLFQNYMSREFFSSTKNEKGSDDLQRSAKIEFVLYCMEARMKNSERKNSKMVVDTAKALIEDGTIGSFADFETILSNRPDLRAHLFALPVGSLAIGTIVKPMGIARIKPEYFARAYFANDIQAATIRKGLRVTVGDNLERLRSAGVVVRRSKYTRHV